MIALDLPAFERPATALLEVRKELGDRATVQQFSALKRDGEDEARAVLEQFLAGEGQA
ncbi:MAG: hypothetical protein KJP08_00865 [Gammaproteobacteria bacterium]|nr:hypothetical protein [Gammaproteobacteria bacterium]